MTALGRVLPAVLISILAGCAASPAHGPMYVLPGRVAVVSAKYAPSSDFNILAKGRAESAAHYAGSAAGDAGAATALTPHLLLVAPLMPYVVVGAAVIAGVAGAAHGSWSGLPEEQAKAIRKSMDDALSDLKVSESMARYMAVAGSELPTYKLSYEPDEGPASPMEKRSYFEFSGRGVDIVVEVGVTNVGFIALSGEGQRVLLEMTAIFRVVSPDGTQLFSRTFKYGTRPRPASQWSDGQVVRQAFDECYRRLAQFAIEVMFAAG